MSDRDTWPDNPNDPPSRRAQQASEKSSGGCLKYALIFGGIGFATILVCCGGMAWIGWGFIPKMVTTPAEVTALSQEVMAIDIPDEFVGNAGVSIDNWLLTMRFATYRHKNGKGMLLIGSMQIKLGDMQNQQADFRAKAAKQSNDERKLIIKKTEEREFTIRGKQVPFKFSEAEQEGTNAKFRLVSGEFQEAGRITLFELSLDEETYDEDAVVKMIESIK